LGGVAVSGSKLIQNIKLSNKVYQHESRYVKLKNKTSGARKFDHKIEAEHAHGILMDERMPYHVIIFMLPTSFKWLEQKQDVYLQKKFARLNLDQHIRVNQTPKLSPKHGNTAIFLGNA
jgi:hypothetical protein